MKRSILMLLIAAFIIGIKANAQDVKGEQSESPETLDKSPIYWLYDAHYRMAIQYNDFAEAKSALYNLIILEPQNDSLRFNLAYLYFDAGKYPSAVLTCRDVLAINPNNLGALELSGASYENLGLKDKALASYEKLYMATTDINTLYKMAFLQYDLKKYNECNVNVDILLENNEVGSTKVVFQTKDKISKEYPMKVAVLNLKGLVNKELGNNEEAKKAFEQALAIAPDFEQAKTNLDELNK
ncbi:MAG: tetratricopeptide repeat protein [Cyclobacteriaceae bacterium]|nr:tetratricopeptide repeat protein [Cyclobacteriaceae bacterium]